jgi:methylglyoxal reductase
MQYRELGQSGLRISVIGIGTWASSGWMWGKTDIKESIRAIQSSIDYGINLIDTAPAYGLGESEKIVAQSIRGRRDKVIIATKFGLIWHKAEGEYHFSADERGRFADGKYKLFKNLTPASIRYEVENSLKRLDIETIDLYQSHWQNNNQPISETMSELLKLKDEGKIRAIGVSNIKVDELESYRKYGQVDSDQEKYSMLDREHELDLIPYCEKNKIAFLAYSPLANGLLTGKIKPGIQFDDADHRRESPRFQPESVRNANLMLTGFAPIAKRYNVSIAQLVIAWTFHQPGVTCALVGVRNPRHVIDNSIAGDIILDPKDVKIIDEIIN